MPLLLTSHTSAGFQTTTNTEKKVKTLPKCVVEYNKAMGGVDLSDARLYRYLSERRSTKWTSKVVFSLLGRAVLNSYIIYQKNTSDRIPLKRYQFTVCLVESLLGDFRPCRKIVRKRRSKTELAVARQTPQAPLPPFQNPANPVTPGPS